MKPKAEPAVGAPRDLTPEFRAALATWRATDTSVLSAMLSAWQEDQRRRVFVGLIEGADETPPVDVELHHSALVLLAGLRALPLDTLMACLVEQGRHL